MAYTPGNNCMTVAFKPASGYTPAVGDLVKISAAWEVNKASASDVYLGRVELVDSTQPLKTVVVRVRYNALVQLTAAAAVNPGVALACAGTNKVTPYVKANDDILDVVGISVESAAADGSTFYALIF